MKYLTIYLKVLILIAFTVLWGGIFIVLPVVLMAIFFGLKGAIVGAVFVLLFSMPGGIAFLFKESKTKFFNWLFSNI